MALVSPSEIARPFLDEVRGAVAELPPIRLVGLLASDRPDAASYSSYAARGCAKVGISYEERKVPSARLSRAIFEANTDPDVHGILVYYPVFGGARDRSLQNEVDAEKDVEGLHGFWTQRLYHDVRFADRAKTKKAILPCTPLGVVKALAALGVYRLERKPREQLEGVTVTIFNRSEVVGRPLAALLAHDGAVVHSFDIDGVVRYEREREEPGTVTRAEALRESQVVVSAVPDPSFELIRADELHPEAVCVNVAYVPNFADDVEDKAKHLLNRVGPITVAMLLRNTLRLYRNFAS